MGAMGYNCGFRFASYKQNKIPTHVYNFVICNGKKYTFDACVESLKESPRYTYIKDMKVQYLSGLPIMGNDFEYLGGKEERQARRAKRREEGKGVFQKVKKVVLAVPRQAFRGIVALNVRGLAKHLDEAIKKDSNKVKAFWQKVGGKFEGNASLKGAIESGKNKKPLFGEKKGVNGHYDENEEYIGFAIEGAIVAATPILLAVKKLLTDLGIKPEDIKNLISKDEEDAATESGNRFTDGNFEAADDENKKSGFSPSPLLIGGVVGGLALFYLLTKKKK
jgi:hypothetical protein